MRGATESMITGTWIAGLTVWWSPLIREARPIVYLPCHANARSSITSGCSLRHGRHMPPSSW
jgi:hypothetical protein